MDTKQFNELILQSLEHELGGLQVYETALKCAVDDELGRNGKSISRKPDRTSKH